MGTGAGMSLFQMFIRDAVVKQPCVLFVLFKRTCRYLKVGRLLHLVALAGSICFYWFGNLALEAFARDHIGLFCLQGYLSLYGLVLVGFSQMDARSRFQNYKLAKDLFFEHGFKERIANLFVLSRCQREAVLVAASDLGLEPELRLHYDNQGYRWFHLIPDRVLSNPSILLSRRFWKKTLFVPCYSSRHFLW